MVNRIFKLFAAVLFVLSLAACSKKDFVESLEPTEPSTIGELLPLTLSAKQDHTTRAVLDGGVTKWNASEYIGVVAAKDGSFTGTDMQPFVSKNASLSQTAQFSGSLQDGGEGTYRLYAISPYKESVAAANPTYNLPQIQTPEAGSWDPACVFMLGISDEQEDLEDVSEATGGLTFTHKLGWLCMSFNGFDSAMDEEVVYVRISSSVTMAGDFTANLTEQTINTTGAVDKFIIADYSSKHIRLEDLQAYITMFPGTYSSVDIAVKTKGSATGQYGHYIECTRTNLTISAGCLMAAEVSADCTTTGCSTEVASSMSSICGTSLPSKSSKTDALNVLLIGHSFGIDCTEHLPGLLSDAGISNLNLCRFHNNDCQLNEYWNFIKTKGTPQQYYSRNGSGWNQSIPTPGIVDKFIDIAWDIIVLQQSTCDGRQQSHPNWGGAADYSTYQPYLSLMIEYIVCTQRTRLNKSPYIVWNMIRSSKSNYEEKYSQIVDATRSLKAETGIGLILTPGTAMMTARKKSTYGFDFTNPDIYHILCRDIGSGGWHASEGLGRYLEACTWFEQLVVPVYKAADANLSVVGNNYLPTAYCLEWSGEDDKVTAEKAAALQAIAHATRVADPADNAANEEYPGNPFYSTNPR